eukprot:2510099-Prymnesium_polylepis.1
MLTLVGARAGGVQSKSWDDDQSSDRQSGLTYTCRDPYTIIHVWPMADVVAKGGIGWPMAD